MKNEENSKQQLDNELSELRQRVSEMEKTEIENKCLKEELRSIEDKYRGIYEESVAVIYQFDSEKNFIDSNQAGLDLLGFSREELLSMSIPDVDADTVVTQPAHQQLARQTLTAAYSFFLPVHRSSAKQRRYHRKIKKMRIVVGSLFCLQDHCCT